MVAAWRGYGEVVDMLIKAKADVNHKNTDVRIAISKFYICLQSFYVKLLWLLYQIKSSV